MDSTQPAKTPANQISHQLHRHLGLPAAPNCMLLLDPVLRPISDADAIAERHWEYSYTPVRLAPHVDPTEWPQLVSFDVTKFSGSEYLALSVEDACEELAPEALRTGAGRRIGGWLATRASAKEVAKHLARTMVQNRPGDGPTWLRVHDPAVMWWLWSFLSPGQRRLLLGPVDTLWILDPSGQLVALRAEVATTKGNTAPLALTDDLWRDVDCIAPLNLALREWARASALDQRIDPLCTGALDAVRRAMAAGFHSKRDLTAYAQYALKVHPRFDAHLDVQKLIAQRRSTDYFTRLVDGLNEEDWKRIARECVASDAVEQPVGQTQKNR
ncbi:DUF4123 domain-containing protein [Variovorax rhizosphaerae]|uniref:DUF4123 domain-containing protein n=1 Tax=Variovorax rhizosphaerae TaxID=1836200 RepID=A0ABU8WFE7_9BURK